MENKQSDIISVISQRIADGTYTGKLPKSSELAAEFSVNIKTVNKALLRMAKRGVVIRKRHVGTIVVKQEASENSAPRMIEVLYEGFTAIFSHPFWGDIWDGMVTELARLNCRPVLNMLNSDPETGLLNTDDIHLMPDTAKIILGISEQRLFNKLKEMEVPYIVCEQVDDPETPQIVFDMQQAIADAVNYLFDCGCRRIAFVGLTGSLVDPGHVQKYRHFIRALQRYCKIDPALIADTRPLAGAGAGAMRKILERTTCDAVFAAYDHQLPDIYSVLEEYGLEDIPVIGCDGLAISGVPETRYAVVSPRRRCGVMLASGIVDMLDGKYIPRQQVLTSRFARMPVSFSDQEYL
ncbi:MAG: substrate-binding domain-containing protein [Lentisphaeria bacterium]|nr:substrate-binding domain-containing protein [Lentisphaeria bacterium]